MVKMLAVELRKFDRKFWVDEYGVVVTDVGEYRYGFEYETNTWIDHDDYLDNVRSDFEDESTFEGGIDDSSLFEKLTNTVSE